MDKHLNVRRILPISNRNIKLKRPSLGLKKNCAIHVCNGNNVYENADYAHIAKELKAELQRLKELVGDTDEKYPALMNVREEYWD